MEEQGQMAMVVVCVRGWTATETSAEDYLAAAAATPMRACSPPHSLRFGRLLQNARVAARSQNSPLASTGRAVVQPESPVLRQPKQEAKLPQKGLLRAQHWCCAPCLQKTGALSAAC
mmetsp:Transcript_68299/g.119052  ORF Transcript_68299/g.119052 Transcript_68299/m.119052 type:complete len:117 (-) Transcript_68299:966-1316(-)